MPNLNKNLKMETMEIITEASNKSKARDTSLVNAKPAVSLQNKVATFSLFAVTLGAIFYVWLLCEK